MEIDLICDSKTKTSLGKQLETCVDKYKDLIDNNQFDEVYEKLSTDESVSGLMISALTLLNNSALGNSWVLKLHNIPDYFLTSTDVQNYTVPDGCQVIGKEAFYNCKNLITISIPKSITKIKENAFANCPNLKTIYYNGTENDARKVDIEKGNDDFRSANCQTLK